MRPRIVVLIALALAFLSTAVGAQPCLSYGSEVTLTGRIRERVFENLKKYESTKGFYKSKEKVLFLTLDRSICTTGHDQTGFHPQRRVRQLQIAISSDYWDVLRLRKPERIHLTGSLFHRFTPSQRTRVLIQVVRFSDIGSTYPDSWFAHINDPKKPDWEILPQERHAGEVILSKRNELGILSNFAATPFELYGKRYASVEGFWQMMLYPEGPDDERAKAKGVEWKYAREEVAQMTAFKAKSAGELAEDNMKELGIDWVTFDGKRFPYRSATPGEHYKLILAAMRAKLEQNPEVKRILLATGDLILKPDHVQEVGSPPEWKYYEIWMQLRSDLQKR